MKAFATPCYDQGMSSKTKTEHNKHNQVKQLHYLRHVFFHNGFGLF